MIIEKPIFIVGAPRSGKKWVSQVLGKHPQAYAFPYEMNFLWRYRNARYPYDRLFPSMLTERIRTYIRKKFEEALTQHGKSRIVDRTDHNVVRLDYVQSVFPDCLIIHVIRDGRAAVASAILRRQEKLGIWLYLEKSLTVPALELPYYATLYLKDIVQARLEGRGYKNLWGIKTTLTVSPEARRLPLAEKCALQWCESVRAAKEFEKDFSPDRYLSVRYEDMVQNPIETFQNVFRFVGLDWTPEVEAWLLNNVSRDSLDKWRKTLSEEDLRRIMPYLNPFMEELNYQASF